MEINLEGELKEQYFTFDQGNGSYGVAYVAFKSRSEGKVDFLAITSTLNFQSSMGHIKLEQLQNDQIFKEQKRIQDEMIQQVRFGVK